MLPKGIRVIKITGNIGPVVEALLARGYKRHGLADHGKYILLHSTRPAFRIVDNYPSWHRTMDDKVALRFIRGGDPEAEYVVFCTAIKLVLASYSYDRAVRVAENYAKMHPGCTFQLAKVLAGGVTVPSIVNDLENPNAS